MPKHARPRASRPAIVVRHGKTLLIAAVSGGVLVSSGFSGVPSDSTLTASSHPAAAAEVVTGPRETAAVDTKAAAIEAAQQQQAELVAARKAAAAKAAAKAKAAAAAKAKAAREAKARAEKAAREKAAREKAAREAAARAAAERAAQARAARSSARAALPSGFGARVLAMAARYAGSPYVYGGTTPSGFDCSGYVGYVFGQLGISLPRTAAAMYSATTRVSASDVRPGDLVFVHKGGGVSHVAIYAGGGYWWEASRPGTPVGKHRAWTSSVSYGRVAG